MSAAPKPKRGRPATGKSPVRQLGRVNESDWAELKQAFVKSGETSFTKWAVAILLRAARKK